VYKMELLVGAMAASVLFYIAAMWAMKSEELQFLRRMVKRRRQG